MYCSKLSTNNVNRYVNKSKTKAFIAIKVL